VKAGMSEGVNGLKAILPTSINRGMSLFQPVPAKMRDVSSKSRVMGDYQARFRERFRGETPLYLLDVCPAMNQGTFKYRNIPDNQEESSLKLIHLNFR
jgi:hypothetical protein